MTTDQLKEKQAQMSNDELIKKVEHQITELARTGGRSHIMCVPPEITDTDMILSELVRRFKGTLDENRKKLTDLRVKYKFYKKLEKKLEKVMNAELELEDWQEEVYSKISLMEIELEDLKIEMDIPDSEYNDLESD